MMEGKGNIPQAAKAGISKARIRIVKRFITQNPNDAVHSKPLAVGVLVQVAVDMHAITFCLDAVSVGAPAAPQSNAVPQA